MHRTGNRSGYVLPSLALMLALAAGCASQNSPTRPSAGDRADSAIAVAPQGEGQSAIAAVKRATAAFHDLDKAIAAGYLSPAGLPCDESPAGAMGIHAANPALMAPGLDPLQPEVLLYLPKPGGGFRLVGVEYLQPALVQYPDGHVAPWFSTDPWPADHTLVTPTPTLFGASFQGPMPGHIPGMPWHYDLHVWAWAPNPSGTFAQWNPSISCPG